MPGEKKLTGLFGGTATKSAFGEIHNSLHPVRGIRVSFDEETGNFLVGLNNTVGQEAIPSAVDAAHEFYEEKIPNIRDVTNVGAFKYSVI